MSAGGLYVGYARLPHGEGCGKDVSVAPQPTVVILPLSKAPTPQGFTSASINGIAVERQSTYGIVDVWAPQLAIFLSVDGGGYTSQILHTLTYSPAAEALATGPAPTLPASWKWVSAGSLRLAAPSLWTTTTGNLVGSQCGFEVALQNPDTVVLDQDTSTGGCPGCPACSGIGTGLGGPRPPTNGVVVDLHPNAASGWPPNQRLNGTCTSRNGVTLCPYERSLSPGNDQNAEMDILFEQVTVQGTGRRYVVEIGLAGNGLVARTVLYSLRTA